MLWSCRYSVEIWKETERQINERFRTNLEIKYHNVIMGFNPENCKNHAAINTIIMAVKKRICYKGRLKTHDPATIRNNTVLNCYKASEFPSLFNERLFWGF